MVAKKPKKTQDTKADTKSGPKSGRGRVHKGDQGLRDLEILRLYRDEDMSLRDIAPLVGYADQSGVAKALKRILAQNVALEVDEYRQVEYERLGNLRKKLIPYFDPLNADEVEHLIESNPLVAKLVVEKYMDKQLGAMDRYVKLSAEMRKIMGVDSPAKQEVTGAEGAPLQVVMGWPAPQADTPVVNEEDLPK